MANKLAVYTCVTGGYDPLLAPSVVDPRLDYFCFTNSDIPPPTPWRHVHLPPSTLNDKDQSRFAKMHPHKLPSLAGYDATLYIDGTIDIVGDVRRFIEESIRREGDIFMFDHPYWDTLLDEADIVQAGVQADGLQTAEIQLLKVVGVRLQDHLILIVMLQAVGVLAIAAVAGPPRS